MNPDSSLEKMNVLILSHFYARASASGPPQDLRDFLLPKVKSITYIEHPFPYNKNLGEDTRSSMTVYERGAIKSELYLKDWSGSDVSFYIKDFFATQYFLMKARRKFDLCIALDNLNTLSVIPWRKIGIIKKLVYYTIDYNPQRFPGNLLNKIYHLIDKICCYNADLLWNLAENITKGRIAKGIDIKKSAPGILLPMGSHLSRIEVLPFEKVDRHKIAYVGHLSEKQGIQMTIQALPEIRKAVPDVRFMIIGKGDYHDTLVKLVKDNKVEDIVEFKGFVKDHIDVEKMLCRAAIGMALYVPEESNFVFYTDAGKPKLYMGCGLPIVISKFHKIAYEIAEHKAGIMTEYDSKAVAEAVIKLLTDDLYYKECRRNVIELAKNYDTDKILERVISETLS